MTGEEWDGGDAEGMLSCPSCTLLFKSYTDLIRHLIQQHETTDEKEATLRGIGRIPATIKDKNDRVIETKERHS